MSKRTKIVPSEGTVETTGRMARRGQRSWSKGPKVQHFVTNQSTETLRSHLEVTAIPDRDLDRRIAAEWSAADAEDQQS